MNKFNTSVKISNKKILLISNLIFIFSIFMLLTAIYIGNSERIKYLLLFTIVIQFITIIKYRKNNIVFIFMIFLLSYYSPLIQHYFNGKGLTYHSLNFIESIDEKTVYIYCLFSLILVLTLGLINTNKNYQIINGIEIRDNKYIFYICIVFIGICIIFGHTSNQSFGEYSSNSNILNEYIIIVFIIAYVYSNKKKSRISLIILLYILFTLVNFYYGDRIAVIQVSLLIMYLIYNKKINYKHIMILLLIMYCILSIIGVVRSGGSIANYKINSDIIDTNQTQVFNSSVQIYRLVSEGHLNNQKRFESFIEYNKRLIFSTSKLSDLSNLSLYSQKIVGRAQGGGFIAVYAYVWGGIVGVILSGVIVGFIISGKIGRVSTVKTIMIIVAISLYPRWIAYDPLIMIKMPIYAGIAWKVLDFINLITKKNIKGGD